MTRPAVLCFGLWAACALTTPVAGQQPLQLFRLGGEFQVNTATGVHDYPAVAMDARGNFLVTWDSLEQDTSSWGVFAQRYDHSGAPVGTEFQMNTYVTGTQSYSTLAFDFDGDFVVAWTSFDQDGQWQGIVAKRFSSSGSSLGTEFIVNAYTAFDQRHPIVAMERNGDFVVAWNSYSDQDGADDGIFAQRFSSGGNALGTEFQVNSHTVFKQYRPSVSMDDDGDLIVVWGDYSSHDGDDKGVFGQRFTSSGTRAGAEFLVNTYTIGAQGAYERQVVASDADGDFVVVWGSYYQDGGYAGVFGQRFARSGARVGTEFQVNSYTIGDQGGFFGESVASDSSGNFLAVWTVDTPSFDAISGQAFRAAGTRVGAEFQVSSPTVDAPFVPAVAADVDGDFVVVWKRDVVAGADIFGQRFVLAYEVESETVGIGGDFGTDTGEGDGAGSQDRIETTVTSPNAGTIAITEKLGAAAQLFGFAFLGQQVDITAPSATSGNPLRIVFELDRSLFAGNVGNPNIAVYRNGVLVPNCAGFVTTCVGGPTVASPDPCVANRCLQGDLDAEIAVLSSSASDWSFAVPCTTGFAKGLLLVRENAPGKEKLIAKLIGGPALAQEDFGNPLATGGTAYRLRVYDDAQNLAAEIPVERAGDATCSGGATSCWKALGGAPPGGKGYKYKDSDAAANGVTQLMLKSAASSKVLFNARGPSPPFLGGIAAALSSTTSVTIELHGDGAPAGCFTATLADIKTQEPDAFKAK